MSNFLILKLIILIEVINGRRKNNATINKKIKFYTCSVVSENKIVLFLN